MQEYAREFKLFYNTSCTPNSVPGYKRLGFVPVVTRVYLARYNLLRHLRHRLKREVRKTLQRRTGKKQNQRALSPTTPAPTRGTRHSGILVSDRPRPEEMAALVAQENRPTAKFRLVQDERFFRWRYNAPLYSYEFHYLLQAGVAIGYMVVRVAQAKRRAFIIDYAAQSEQALASLLARLVQAGRFDTLLAYRYGMDERMQRLLDSQRFRPLSTEGLLGKPLASALGVELFAEMPLLIRPVREKPTEADYYVGGLDVRDSENWALKPIFDSAT
jgi:hypothetical protein